MVRKREIFIDRFGPEVGPKLYHALQSQAAHAGVSARLRRKLEALERGERPSPPRSRRRQEVLPLFPEDPIDGPAHTGSAPSVKLEPGIEAAAVRGKHAIAEALGSR